MKNEEQKHIEEIIKSVQSHVACYGIEGTEDIIKKYNHCEELQLKMLAVLYELYDFGDGNYNPLLGDL